MAPSTGLVGRAHIQDFHSGQPVEHHWGYADRIVPCTSDAGSCEYLDTVYHSHDLGMTYTWILWVVLMSVFILLVALRFVNIPSQPASNSRAAAAASSPKRAFAAVSALCRRHLLPETCLPGLWAHTTRLQVLILAIFLAYLFVFSFVGITYKSWITPVKKNPSLHNFRSALGPWADRVGVLAYAITPLAVFLSARESILSLATGIPSQHFIFLHAWIGRVIFIQSFLHTLGWTLVEGRFYQPQPYAYTSVMSEQYIIFGCVAMFLVSILYVFSLKRVVAWTGHEIFRKVHYLVALLYLGACWGHWAQLSCWMIASLIVVLLDRAVRLLRVGMLHLDRGSGSNPGGLLDIYPFQAKVSTFTDAIDGRTVVRLDVLLPENEKKRPSWRPGQHFYVCFPELNLWQSHPFTVANLRLRAHVSSTGKESSNEEDASNVDNIMTFILRTHAGQTSRVLSWAMAQQEDPTKASRTLSVVLTGPYGVSVSNKKRNQNVLALAAGTGITYTLPLAIEAAESQTGKIEGSTSQVEHIWIIREPWNIAWLPKRDLSRVRHLVAMGKLKFSVFVTREVTASAILPRMDHLQGRNAKQTAVEVAEADLNRESSNLTAFDDLDITRLDGTHPDLSLLLREHINQRADSLLQSSVVASGPADMLADVRRAVAQANSPSRVWRGKMKWNIDLWCDDRLG